MGRKRGAPQVRPSTEEVELGAADEPAGGAPGTRRVANAPDDRDRHRAVLLHYQAGRGRHLVRQGDDGVVQLLAVQVATAAQIEERIHPGAADGDLDQALAPRTAE